MINKIYHLRKKKFIDILLGFGFIGATFNDVAQYSSLLCKYGYIIISKARVREKLLWNLKIWP